MSSAIAKEGAGTLIPAARPWPEAKPVGLCLGSRRLQASGEARVNPGAIDIARKVAITGAASRSELARIRPRAGQGPWRPATAPEAEASGYPNEALQARSDGLIGVALEAHIDRTL